MRSATKLGDDEAKYKIKELIGEEKGLLNRKKKEAEDWEALKKLKKMNKERAVEGKPVYFAKKRDIKELKLKDKFEELESKGHLDKYM